MSKFDVFVNGGSEKEPSFSPKYLSGCFNLTLNISDGDLFVPTMHLAQGTKGLSFKCPISQKDVIRLVPRAEALKSGIDGDPVCIAMDSVLKSFPSSALRGGKKRVERSKGNKYVCFGVNAARGHTGLNNGQGCLTKVPKHHQSTLMKYAFHADKLHAWYLPAEDVYQARWANHVSQCPTFNLPDISKNIEFFGSWGTGINVCLSMHQDLGDFLWSHVSVQCKGEITNKILAYFCFPTLGFAIPLRCGDHLLFNPAVPHMISSRTCNSDNVYSLALYFKTNILGGNDNSASLTELQKEFQNVQNHK